MTNYEGEKAEAIWRKLCFKGLLYSYFDDFLGVGEGSGICLLKLLSGRVKGKWSIICRWENRYIDWARQVL